MVRSLAPDPNAYVEDDLERRRERAVRVPVSASAWRPPDDRRLVDMAVLVAPETEEERGREREDERGRKMEGEMGDEGEQATDE